MNIFISADVEGVAGVVSWDQVTSGSHDYAVGRALMAAEVNAAIEGAYNAGAERVVVNDSHGRMTNLLPESLDQRARLVSGHFKPLYMLQGIDDSFDAAFFVGYHGAIGEPDAILSHTYNPQALWEVKVDGVIVGETGVNRLVCDYFGVPVRLVTGDQSTVLEAHNVIPGVHVAEVKRSFGRYSAESMSPENARTLIRAEAESCLTPLPRMVPVRRCVEMELTFLVADMASMAQWIRGVERIDSRTVRFQTQDGLDAYRTFYAVLMLTRAIVE